MVRTKQRASRSILLAQREISDGLGIFSDLADEGGADDADDFVDIGIDDDGEALAEGILARPNHIGHGFVDDNYRFGILAVEIGEIAAAQRRNAKGGKVAGKNTVKTDDGAAVVGIGLLAFAEHGNGQAAADYAVGRNGGVGDTGNGFGALEGIAEELLAVIGV